MSSKPVTFRIPTQITLGTGTAETIGTEAKRLGARHAFLLVDPVLHKAGVADQLLKALDKEGVRVTTYTEIEMEPSVQGVAKAVAAARAAGGDLVVGLGGGSTLDTAKAAAMLLGNPGVLEDYLGIGLVPRRGAPSILLPTTAGTGAEITPNALYYVPAKRVKEAVVSPHIIPDVAICDSLLTTSVPPAVTAATGVDALCHAVEAYTSVNANALTDPYALDAVRLIGGSLRTAVRTGSDLPAREAMTKASLLAGIAIGNAGTNAVHALAYPLQGQHRITHGVSNSLLLPYVLDFNVSANTGKFARVAEALGESLAGLSEEAAARRAAEAAHKLSKDVGIPERLSQVGIRREHLPALVEGAMKVTRLLNNNPRPVRSEDARAIYEAAL
ncbi:MAG TPA: iron-containing alcohol dehydrogenase [Candidatus Sulfotelmatobacter sp.]|nr:iron-containing alcohol dehydrogenase [Candidatus Sulfotelmatobacter sp.]